MPEQDHERSVTERRGGVRIPGDVWRRDQVMLGMVFSKDVPSECGPGEYPLLYRVVGLIDEPVAVLEPMDERDGEDREYHVISSPNFAEFYRVTVEWPNMA